MRRSTISKLSEDSLRRQVARLGKRNRRHPLDEGYVVDAMARQIEEIRNLPEVAR